MKMDGYLPAGCSYCRSSPVVQNTQYSIVTYKLFSRGIACSISMAIQDRISSVVLILSAKRFQWKSILLYYADIERVAMTQRECIDLQATLIFVFKYRDNDKSASQHFPNTHLANISIDLVEDVLFWDWNDYGWINGTCELLKKWGKFITSCWLGDYFL